MYSNVLCFVKYSYVLVSEFVKNTNESARLFLVYAYV